MNLCDEKHFGRYLVWHVELEEVRIGYERAGEGGERVAKRLL